MSFDDWCFAGLGIGLLFGFIGMFLNWGSWTYISLALAAASFIVLLVKSKL
uniref:Uncharacterized protein n=1 Tax=viral metagenome TaxID=1070528 RepID=A0A6M3L869_9ZZZZ